VSTPDVLVVAATEPELAPAHGWRTLCCGVGPVDAAIATAAELAARPPAAVLHVGIAGARRGLGLPPGTLVVGTEARYADPSVDSTWVERIATADPGLLAAVRAAFADIPAFPIGTSARVGGTTWSDVEAMEGFAVLRAAAHAGVPAVEVRAIANDIEERDRSRWHFDAAFGAITAATPALVRAVAAALRS
jgi:futalosine hydrolase